MHFVDDVDLVAPLDRSIAHAFQQGTHVVDAGLGCRIEFQHIDVPALDDRAAIPALLAEIHGRNVNRFGFVVERPGQQPRRGGLADAAHAGEHEGMRDPARGEGVAQGADHRLLPI